MNFKMILAFLLTAFGLTVRADYLLWMVDQSQESNPIAFAFAKLAVSGEGVEKGTYLTIAGTDGETVLGHASFPDPETGLATKMAYADLGQYGALAYSFAAELYAYEGEVVKMVGISDYISYGALMRDFHVYANMQLAGIDPHVFSSFSAPEPTGGLLVLLGVGILALRRRRTCGTRVMTAALVLLGAGARADYIVPCEQFDVSRVVRGKGEVSVACAAVERRFETAAAKHFFGMGTPVPFAVEIPVGGDALEFEASCGVDKGGAKGAVVLKVYGDGRLLFTSEPTSRGDTNEVPVKVDVTGVEMLMLEAEPFEGSGDGVIAVWGDARLLYRDDRLLPNDVRRTSRQLGILTPPEHREPRVNGPRVYGVRSNRPILYRVPVTGEDVTVQVEGEGVGWTFDPATRILAGAIEKPGDYRLRIVATNAFGRDEKPFVIKVGEKLALTPVMGWSSWNAFSGGVKETDVRTAADALVATGLADHGYAYVNTDDFWQNIPERAVSDNDPTLDGPLRDANGNIAANKRFPDLKGMVDHIHAKGLKAGIYSSPGPFTCGRAAGSWQHEESDAKFFAEIGFDYLKHDWCFYDDVAFGKGLDRAMYPYLVMGRALAHQKRDIVLSMCQYGMENVSAWGRLVGAQSWRTTGDVFDTWSSISAAIEKQKKLFYYTEPGAWNDPDMLCVGCVIWNGGKPCRLAPNEQYTHISMWALVAAPLMIGCDLTKLDPFTRSLLTNDEVIEIDQDSLGKGAGCIAEGDGWEIWARPLADGSVAAGLFNKSNREQTITFSLEQAGLLCKWRVRDVWRQEDVGVFHGTYENSVPGHATHLIRLFPLPCGHFREGMTDVRENAWRLLREKDLKSAR